MNISILGAGWLGMPLAHQLMNRTNLRSNSKNRIAISKTSACEEILPEQINTHICRINLQDDDQIDPMLFETDLLIVTIPPGFRKKTTDTTDTTTNTKAPQISAGERYYQKWQIILDFANKANVKKLIMTSSTAVYADDLSLATEDSASGFNQKASDILAVENLIKAEFKGDWLICRLAGLYGPNRHAGRFVEKMKTISQVAPANMLHLDDATAALLFLIDQNISHQVINISSPITISKADFYQIALTHHLQQTNQHGSPQNPTQIISAKLTQSNSKKVSSEKLIQLGYQFKYANPAAPYLEDQA